MKNKDLIEKLKQFPMDMEVCIFDGRKSIEAGDDSSNVGIHPDFEVYIEMSDDELIQIREDEGEHVNNWIALEFDSEEEE